MTPMPGHQQELIVILQGDDSLHTDEHPFCSINPTCPCHEDPERIAVVAEAVARGELTPDEATNFVLGKMV